eukprot:COSAG01_NODE_18123_length_1099_cov_1.274000_2_plen_118_part_00
MGLTEVHLCLAEVSFIRRHGLVLPARVCVLGQAPWVELADVCHLNARRDFAIPWFLSQAFGEPPPEASLAAQASSITPANLAAKATEWQIPYTSVITHCTLGVLYRLPHSRYTCTVF